MNEKTGQTGSVAVDKLRQYIERVERLEEEKRNLSEDIKDLFTQMKYEGFDIPAVKGVIKLRRIDEHKRIEAEEMLSLYKEALGM